MDIEHRYRLLFEFGSWHSNWTNALTGKEFKFPSGVDLTIQIAIANDTSPLSLYDTSNLSTIKLEFKAYNGAPPNPNDPTLGEPISGTIGDPNLTVEDWQNDVSQHATFTLTPTQSNISAGTYWIAISGVKAPSGKVSVGWGTVEIEEDGTGLTAPVDPLPPSYYTAAQVDDLLANVGAGTPSIYATDAANTKKQTDSTYIYWAWNRIDQTGYKAERRELASGNAAGETTGVGTFPLDLTVLSYS